MKKQIALILLTSMAIPATSVFGENPNNKLQPPQVANSSNEKKCKCGNELTKNECKECKNLCKDCASHMRSRENAWAFAKYAGPFFAVGVGILLYYFPRSDKKAGK